MSIRWHEVEFTRFNTGTGYWMTANPANNRDVRLVVKTTVQAYKEGESRHTPGLFDPLERSCFRQLRRLLDELEAKALDEPEIW